MAREWEVYTRIHESTESVLRHIEIGSLIAMLWMYQGKIYGRVYRFTEERSLPGEGLMLRFGTDFWKDLDSFNEIV